MEHLITISRTGVLDIAMKSLTGHLGGVKCFYAEHLGGVNCLFGDVIPSIPAQMLHLIKIHRDDGMVTDELAAE